MTEPISFHSQFGEDVVLATLYSHKPRGVCIEVGANDGVHGSNTLHFEKRGWQCVLVEPNPMLCAEIRANRRAILFECAASNQAGSATLHIAQGAWRADGMSTISAKGEDHERIARQGFSTQPVEVRTCTLDSLLEQIELAGPIDFVSIDVEGHELSVLEGFTLERWKPAILILEDNSDSSDATIRDYLSARGYRRFRRTGVNDWFAHESNRALVNGRSSLRLAVQSFARASRERLRQISWLRSAFRWLRSLRSSRG